MAVASLGTSFRTTYRFFQRHAHENPIIFWSCAVGFSGPVIAVSVPPIRRAFGWKPAPPIPSSYPLPSRPRRPVQGYEDEE